MDKRTWNTLNSPRFIIFFFFFYFLVAKVKSFLFFPKTRFFFSDFLLCKISFFFSLSLPRYYFFVLVNYFISLFSFFLYLFLSLLSSSIFSSSYSCLKFIIHSITVIRRNTNLSRPPEQGVFFLECFFLFLCFVLQDPSLCSPTNEIVLWGTFPYRYRYLYFP